MGRQQRPPSPTSPTRQGCVELIKTCPNCGSKNILEPDDENPAWLCDDCMFEFPTPLWSEWIDDATRVNLERKSRRRARAAEIARKRDERQLLTQQRQQAQQAHDAETQARREMLVAERAANSTHPVCPNCGRVGAYRSPHRPGEKYRCRNCGTIFDEPLKPGRKRATKKQAATRAQERPSRAEKLERQRAKHHDVTEARWEKKMAAAKVKWHQKYNKDIIKINFKINNEQTVELYGTRAELTTDVKEMMSQIIEEVHEENRGMLKH